MLPLVLLYWLSIGLAWVFRLRGDGGRGRWDALWDDEDDEDEDPTSDDDDSPAARRATARQLTPRSIRPAYPDGHAVRSSWPRTPAHRPGHLPLARHSHGWRPRAVRHRRRDQRRARRRDHGQQRHEADTSVYDKKVKTLQTQLQANPKNAAALAALTRAQVQQASVTGYDQNAGTYSRQGIEGLQAAGQTWDRYLALDPKNPDAGVAALMVSAYSSGALNDPQQAARALDVVIDARGGSAALYSQLAILHYAAGDVRRSVIAEKQALKRTPRAAAQAC